MQAVADYLILCGYQPTQLTVCARDEPDDDLLPGMGLVSGEHYLDDIASYDRIIRSPSVSPYQPALASVVERVESSLSLFDTAWCDLSPDQRPTWIAVT